MTLASLGLIACSSGPDADPRAAGKGVDVVERVAFEQAALAVPASTTSPGGVALAPPSGSPRTFARAIPAIPHGATQSTMGRTGAGSSSSNTPDTLPAGSAELVSASPTPLVFGVGACTSQNIKNNGGPTIANPRINRVFWGNWVAATANGIDNTWSAMAGTPAFYRRLTEYNVGTGSSGSRVNYATGGAGALAEATITAGLTAAINAAGITPTTNDVFAIFLPSGTSSQRDTTNGWAGHHDHYTATIKGSNYNVRYTVEESAATDYLNSITSHELSETFTDPDFSAYYDPNNCGGCTEIGDICRFAALPGGYNRIAGTQMETIWSQTGCRCVGERDLNDVDFTAAGVASNTVFRPSNTIWYSRGGSPNWIFGASSDTPYGGDYNGDGQTEFSLFRDGASANIFVLNVVSGTYNTYSWGTTGDKPVPGDYDGDGKTDLAVWRPSNGTWYISSSATGSTITTQWGVNGDIPVAADYDKDRITDIAVFRPSNGTWYVLPSTAPGTYIWSSWTGTFGDVPVPGDYNSDGEADWAYWHPSDGTFHVWYKDTNTAFIQPWGTSGDIPVTADYDADWFTDMAVWRPSSGTWFTIKSSTGGTSSVGWGASGDVPVLRDVLR